MKKVKSTKKPDLKLCKTCVKGSCCRHGVSACLFEVATILKKNKHLMIKKPWFIYIGVDFEHTESGFDFETKVIKQGNSNVIVLPKRLGLEPKDIVKILVVSDNVSKVSDAAGLLKTLFKKISTDQMLKKVKKDLWGD